MPLSSMLRLSALPGDMGLLTRLYTNGDIAHDIELVTRCLVAAGLHRASVAGWLGNGSDSRLLDLQYGLEFVGATVVAMGDCSAAWQLLACSHLIRWSARRRVSRNSVTCWRRAGKACRRIRWPRSSCFTIRPLP